MRTFIALAGLALLTAACGKAEPVKRQPGSWSQKIEILEFTGPGVTPAQKGQMQSLMNFASGMSMCVTPEMAAQEDRQKALATLGGQGDCTVTSNDISGSTIAFVTECKEAGKTVRVTADGTSSGTAQNIRMTVETVAGAKDAGKLVMNVVATRNGECKPGDINPTIPATTPKS